MQVERATGNNLAVKNTFANGVLFEDGTMVITIRAPARANDPSCHELQDEPWGGLLKLVTNKPKNCSESC